MPKGRNSIPPKTAKNRHFRRKWLDEGRLDSGPEAAARRRSNLVKPKKNEFNNEWWGSIVAGQQSEERGARSSASLPGWDGSRGARKGGRHSFEPPHVGSYIVISNYGQ